MHFKDGRQIEIERTRTILLSLFPTAASVPLLPVFRLCLRRRGSEGEVVGRGKKKQHNGSLARLPLEFRSPPFPSTILFALLGREEVKFNLS